MTSFDEFMRSLLARSRNCLNLMGVQSFEDLEKLTAHELIRFPNVGRKSLRDIETKMAMYGRVLADRERIQSTEAEDLKRRQKRVAHKMLDLAQELQLLAHYLDRE